jgi:Fe2+ transport system protein FeoA
LRPGAEVVIVDVDEMAGVIAVRVDEHDHVLALTTAAEIQVAA